MPSKVIRRSVKVRRSPIPSGRTKGSAGGFFSLMAKLDGASARLANSRSGRRR